MCHVDRADQVDLEHTLPVGRLELPEREAELARAGADGEDDVVAPAEAVRDLLGRAADRGESVTSATRPMSDHWREQWRRRRSRTLGSRSTAATWAASAANARAIAAPIPRAAPKTTTTLPARPRSTIIRPRKSVIPFTCALAARLLVAPADVDHPVARRALGILGLIALPGLADLLGGQSLAGAGLPCLA